MQVVGNLKYRAPRDAHSRSQRTKNMVGLNNLLLNNVKLKFGAKFVFLGTTSLFIEIISSSETEAKREAILFLFDCSEVNSTLLITSELINQNARKALFSCVVYTNTAY